MTRFVTDFSTAHKTGASTLTTEPIKAQIRDENNKIITPPPTPLSPAQTGRREAYGRLQDMTDRALRDRSLPLISDEDLKNTLPKPTTIRGLFKTYHREAYASKKQEAEVSASYKNLESTLKEARLSMAELEKLPASALTVTVKPGPKDPDTPAMKTLKTAVKAHYELKNALAEYGKKLGDPGHPVLVAAHRACDRRAGEMISLAAQLQGRTPAELEGVMVKDALRALAVEMHGGKDILEQTAAKAEELFNKLNSLDANPDKLSASFKAKARELDKGFRELEQKIKGELGKSEARPKGGRPVLLREAEVFKPLRQSLDQARARLETLASPPPPLDVDRMLDEIVGLKALDKFIGEARAKLNLDKDSDKNSYEFKLMISPLEELRTELETVKNKLVSDLKKGRMDNIQTSLEMLKKSSASITTAFYSFDTSNDTEKSLQKEFEGLVKFLRRSIDRDDFSLLAREIEEVDNLRKGFSQGGPRPWEREVFLKLAAESPVSFSALVECSLRGIPADQIEYRNVSALAPSRNLGSGVVSTVTLHQFKNEDGGSLELIFKPEHEAYHGLRRLCANNLGYSHLSRTVQLNTASSAVAEAIGCGGVLVKAG
ncbi:MAG: hypothetical protein LBC90_07755, partial [Candidatus Adiutrix sp.]|nr:hypothetical protein [Candidatus Adiutrix sp.]